MASAPKGDTVVQHRITLGVASAPKGDTVVQHRITLEELTSHEHLFREEKSVTAIASAESASTILEEDASMHGEILQRAVSRPF